MKKTLCNIAAWLAPSSPGAARALVPGVLWGLGCTALLLTGHPWLASLLALAVAAACGGWYRPQTIAAAYRAKGWILPTMLVGLALAAVMLLELVVDPYYTAWFWPPYKALALGLGLSLLITPTLCQALAKLGEKAAEERARPGRPAFPRLGFFAAMLAPLAVYWARSFPYLDYVDLQYELEMLRGDAPLSDVHTPAHTALLWLSGGRPEVLTALQLLALAALLTGFAAWLYRRGVGLFCLTAAFTMASLCPVVGEAAVSPIKDMPAALCAGVVLYCILRLLAEDLPLRWPWMLALGAALAFTGLFRHNGLVLTLLAGAWLFCRAIWRRQTALLASVAVCAACVCLVDGVAVPLLGVKSPANGFAVQVYATGIVAVDQKGGQITPEQRQRMEELLPMDYVDFCLSNPETTQFTRAQRLCWSRDLSRYVLSENEQQFAPLLEDRDGTNDVFNNVFILAAGQHPGQIVRLYLELFLQNPWVCATEILRNTTTLWRLDRGYGLFSHVFYLIALALAFVRRGAKGMLRLWPALLPVACNLASVVVAASTNEIRYLLPTFLLTAPTVLFLALDAGKNTQKE